MTHRGGLAALKGFGFHTYDVSPAVLPETVYDLASLTKVVATTPLCMRLFELGKFHLEQPVVEILSGFAGDDPRRAKITFQMLLAHSSGLPAYVKLFERTGDKKELIAQALRLPLQTDPGSRVEYSDIGFILLGVALERIAGGPLENLCRHEIFLPLGERTIGFNSPPPQFQAPMPPTEDDHSFRHRLVQGEVHDENAWVMGGVAGHAGCFGTAGAVAALAECMLRRGAPLFQAHTVELFTRRQRSPAGTSPALGWDTPSVPSQSGKYFSPRSFGHLGFTGTSLWIDPERQLSVTLLTNRTWPDRCSEAIKQIRPAFHDAVVEALEGA